MAKDPSVPQPGPATVTPGAGPDEWLEAARECKYLPEQDMKRLCEIVKEFLMEGKQLYHLNVGSFATRSTALPFYFIC